MDQSDIMALNQLAYRYADAVDACDVERFLAVFTPDGRLRAYHPDQEQPFVDQRGHDELAATPDMMRGMHRRTMHQMTNHLVEIAGDRASGTVLCSARHLGLDGSHTINVYIRYVDRYERWEQEWKIADRQIRFLWSERHEVAESGF